MKDPKVAVLVLCTNEKKYLKGVIHSLLLQTYKNLLIYILDNNSTDGSWKEVQNAKFKAQNQNLKLKTIQFKKNCGYAKGNNIGLKKAFGEGADFCLVLNCDTILKKNTIEEMVKSYQDKKENKIRTGLIQPVILLAKDRKKVNSVGNVVHFLGFGYCQDYLKRYKPFKKDREIISVSGAAMLISKKYYEEIGGFDETFFMTSEDEDLSLRGFLAGYQHFLAKNAVIYHYYHFGRYKLNRYQEEKNRLKIILKNYSLKLILLLLPIFLANEIGIVFYSIFEGWFLLKLKSYFVVLHNLKNIIKNRRKIQADKVISDKFIFSKFKKTIHFKPVDNFLIRNLANPLYWFYYQITFFLLNQIEAKYNRLKN